MSEGTDKEACGDCPESLLCATGKVLKLQKGLNNSTLLLSETATQPEIIITLIKAKINAILKNSIFLINNLHKLHDR